MIVDYEHYNIQIVYNFHILQSVNFLINICLYSEQILIYHMDFSKFKL